jgi:hypothetical protein
MGPPCARAGVADVAVNIAAAQADIVNLFIIMFTPPRRGDESAIALPLRQRSTYRETVPGSVSKQYMRTDPGTVSDNRERRSEDTFLRRCIS